MFKRSGSVQFNFLKQKKYGATLPDTELCFADAGECYIRKILAISLPFTVFSHVYSIRTRRSTRHVNFTAVYNVCTSLSTIDQYRRLRFSFRLYNLYDHSSFVPSVFDVSFVKILFSRRHVLIDFPPTRIA